MLNEEQIVATVPTLELANTLRVLLMRRSRERGPRLTIFVFHDLKVPDEHHIGIASEWGTKVSEDTVLDAMVFITEFQEEQLKAEAEYLGLPPDGGGMDLIANPEGIGNEFLPFNKTDDEEHSTIEG